MTRARPRGLRLEHRARVGVGELARVLGEDVHRTRRWLLSEGVPLRQGKRRGRFYLLVTDLLVHAPLIYEAAALKDAS